jgi:plastocyanin
MSVFTLSRRLALAGALGIMALTGAACSNYSTSNSATIPPHDVLIVSGAQTMGSAAFSPNPHTVSLAAGGRVVWANGDYSGGGYGGGSGVTHHLVSNNPEFDTGDIAPLGTAQHVFTVAGSYGYHCTIHPSMVGTITVTP